MTRRGWLVPHPGDSLEGGLDELRAPVLQTLGVAALLASWVWLAVNGIHWSRTEGARAMIAPMVLLTTASLALLPGDPTGERRVLGRFVLSAGLALALMPGLPGNYGAGQLYLPALAVIGGGALLGPWAALALAAGYSLWYFPLGEPVFPRLDQMFAPFVILWAIVITSWLSSRSLYTALDWALNSQRQAWDAARDARSRREELRRVVSSLEASHERLERTTRELDASRREANEARRLKSEFAANISHELRTPLNIILGFTEIMTRSPEVYGNMGWPRMLHQDLFEIRRNARYLSDFVDDILDLARLDAHRMPVHRRPTDLKAVIDDAVGIVQRLTDAAGIAMILDVPDDLPELYVDDTRIRQVLVNLLSNAIRFTEHGEIRVTARCDGSTVQVTVKDTGMGIPAERLEAIFNQFEQAEAWKRSERAGKGLGLPIARQLVELHGGEIGVESTPNVGSAFHFTLPVGPVQVGQLTPGSPLAAPHVADPVLIVLGGDEVTLRYLVRRMEGVRCISADDWEAALVLARQEDRAAILVHAPSEPAEDTTRSLSFLGDVTIIRCTLPTAGLGWDDPRVARYLTKPVGPATLLHAVSDAAPEGEVLVIDDDRGFVQYVRRALQEQRERYRVRAAYDGADALRQLRSRLPAVVLADLILPDMSGLAVLDAMQDELSTGGVPFILVTGANLGEDTWRTRGRSFVLSRSERLDEDALIRLIRMAMDDLPPGPVRILDDGSVPEGVQHG